MNKQLLDYNSELLMLRYFFKISCIIFVGLILFSDVTISFLSILLIYVLVDGLIKLELPRSNLWYMLWLDLISVVVFWAMASLSIYISWENRSLLISFGDLCILTYVISGCLVRFVFMTKYHKKLFPIGYLSLLFPVIITLIALVVAIVVTIDSYYL